MTQIIDIDTRIKYSGFSNEISAQDYGIYKATRAEVISAGYELHKKDKELVMPSSAILLCTDEGVAVFSEDGLHFIAMMLPIQFNYLRHHKHLINHESVFNS